MATKTTIEQIAKDLAQSHVKADPQTLAVYFLANDQEVRLVEVSQSAVSAAPPEVLAFRFNAPAREGVTSSAVLVILSPDEWQLVQSGELELPAGWDVRNLQNITPHAMPAE